MAQGHSVDEYLETIYFLAFPIGEYRPLSTGSPTLASRVAEMLGVSRASAGEMLKRLEAEGLVERGEHKEAILTSSGRERAERVVRRHRLIERLLTDFMGYTAAESHVHADALGDTFTDDMIERIDERLGHPQRCPHGWPVDPGFEQEENRDLAPLADLEPGERATIPKPSVALWRPKPKISTSASPISPAAPAWPIASPSAKLCSPIPVAIRSASHALGDMPTIQFASNSAAEAAPGPSIAFPRWRETQRS